MQSPLLHTWSLAIEEQFFIAFAVLMVFLVPRCAPRTLFVIFSGLTIASATWMALLASSAPQWAYYSTATRVQALFVGVLLALLVRSDRRVIRVQSRARSIAGWLALLVMLLAFAVDTPVAILMRGGFLLLALASGILIWALLAPSGASTILSWQPLVSLGVISYGVYLWHWPVFLALGADGQSGMAQQAWAVVVTLFLAMASYVGIEKPVRSGRFARWPANRQWLAFLLASMVVAAMAVLPARTQESRERFEWPGAAQVPTRIMLSGDSTMLRLWEYFPWDRYPAVAVNGHLPLGCGIVDVPYLQQGMRVEPVQCQGWQKEWQSKVDSMNPDVAVIGSIVWDGFDRSINGQAYPPGSPQFDMAYVRACKEAIGIAGRSGQIPVFVLGQPCLASTADKVLNDPQRAAKLDELIRSVVSEMPSAHYVDARAFTCSEGGTVADDKSRQPLRDDGVHWSPLGADLVWSTTLRQIVETRTKGAG